jgi:uncharacterized protein YigA (DUF484 family)
MTEKIKTKADETIKIETQADKIKKIETKAYELKENERVEVETALYLQLPGREYSEEDLVKKVEEVWRDKFNRRNHEIMTIDIYLKPEEGKAYFVVNKDVSGDIDI